MRRHLLRITIVASLLVSSSQAFGQPFEPRQDEYEHNAAAMKNASAGDYEGAIVHAKKAVEIRGLNVFWLNLGRFQQRAKRCAAAMNSYTNAITAPPVTNPPAKTVRATAQKYMTELAAECPAQVTVRCTPAELAVVANREGDTNAPAPVACGQKISLQGGTWTFTGTYGTERVTRTEELRIARQYEIELLVTTPVAAEPEVTVSTPDVIPASAEVAAEAEPARDSKVAQIVMLSGGVTALLIGLALDVAPATAHNGELDGMDFVPLGLYVGGLALGIVGIVTW